MPVDYRTKNAVRAAAIALRKKHSALHWEASVDDLIALEGLGQEKFGADPASVVPSLRQAFANITKKIKALLSIKEGIILVSSDLPQAKEPFAKGHEIGHSALEWHRDILFVCDEHDLSAATREQMEFEANAFSAEVLVPSPLLEQVYKKYPPSMETILLVKQWSGASIEVTANQYVAGHPQSCALVILEDEADGDGNSRALVVRRKSLSQAAVRTALGQIARDQRFTKGHPLFEQSRILRTPCSFEMGFTYDNQHVAQVSLYNNGYRTMALLTLKKKIL